MVKVPPAIIKPRPCCSPIACSTCLPAKGSSASYRAICISAAFSSAQVPAAGPAVICFRLAVATLAGFQPVTRTHQNRHTSKNTSSAASTHWPWGSFSCSGSICLRASMAKQPQSAGQVRYIKVAEKPSSVERRMNAYAAMPGRKPSQNSGSRAVPRPLRNAQAAASTSAGIK